MQPRSVFHITSRETLSRFGVMKALQQKLLRLLKIRLVVVTALDVTAQASAAASDEEIRRATLGDTSLFEAAGFRRTLQDKLAKGPGWIFVGEEGLRAWYFLAEHELPISNWLILRTASPQIIWTSGAWVSRDHRGRTLVAQVQTSVLAWSKEQDYRELATWVDRTNHSSLRASHRVGYRVIGKVGFLRCFGFAVVRHGRRWSLGRWCKDRPLVISLEELRQDFGPSVPLEQAAN